jgi:hypothetical protein
MVANYLAAFGIASYRGASTTSYVTSYTSIPNYALDAGDIASAAGWLFGDGLLTRDQALGILRTLDGDPSVDVGAKLYIEELEYGAGTLR